MTRRTFLKSLGVVGAGVAAGLSILPTERITTIETPRYYFPPSEYHGIKFELDPNPLRYRLFDGEWRRAEWA